MFFCEDFFEITRIITNSHHHRLGTRHLEHGSGTAGEGVEKAVGGAAGVVHQGGPLHTDCEPNRNVEVLRLALLAENIESRPLWKPMHKQPVYQDAPAYVNGVSEGIFRRGLCLPSGPLVTDDDVRRIIGTIKENIIY